jgi:hypothetical protein
MANKQQQSGCVPNAYIKANQAGIALTVIISLLTQIWWLLVAVWFIQVVGYKYGARYNLFIRLAKPFLVNSVNLKDVQAAELTRFNSSLAIGMLFAASLSAIFEFYIGAYLFGIMVAIAATAAVLGYCIGCTLYFQYKQFKARRAA